MLQQNHQLCCQSVRLCSLTTNVIILVCLYAQAERDFPACVGVTALGIMKNSRLQELRAETDSSSLVTAARVRKNRRRQGEEEYANDSEDEAEKDPEHSQEQTVRDLSRSLPEGSPEDEQSFAAGHLIDLNVI